MVHTRLAVHLPLKGCFTSTPAFYPASASLKNISATTVDFTTHLETETLDYQRIHQPNAAIRTKDSRVLYKKPETFRIPGASVSAYIKDRRDEFKASENGRRKCLILKYCVQELIGLSAFHACISDNAAHIWKKYHALRPKVWPNHMSNGNEK
jgi:hypothetical protein